MHARTYGKYMNSNFGQKKNWILSTYVRIRKYTIVMCKV